MTQYRLRPMRPEDRAAVAELIAVSTNHWHRAHGGPDIFPDGRASTEVFFDVYQALDPGRGMVAEDTQTGRLSGSCFVHPRETHVSLGIMNVHPKYFGQGIARALLNHVIELADKHNKPVRLVSSAMNLDSFSLYTRAGFVPRRAYQDMFLEVPETGISPAQGDDVRPATPDDAERMAELEMELCGIRRVEDFRYFIENRDGFWHVSVRDGEGGRLDGFMASCGHPGCNMIGPGLARTEKQAAALLSAELDRHRGRRPVFLLPVDSAGLVRRAYDWGARNCEMHFSQVRGPCPPLHGLNFPTFLPETA